MPCRSDYMEPTAQEAYNQRTAQVMVAACNFFPEARHFHDKAVVAANNPTSHIDYTAELCAIFRTHDTSPSLPKKTPQWREMLKHVATDRGVRRLLDWWEDHKEGEERRAKEDAKHTAGPWALTHDERPELGGAFFTIRDSTGGPIAIVLDPDQDTVDDVAEAEEANAKRIVAEHNALLKVKDPAKIIPRVVAALERLDRGEELTAVPDDAGATLLEELTECLRDLGGKVS